MAWDCPPGSGSASRSPVPSRSAAKCCSSTSPPPTSMPLAQRVLAALRARAQDGALVVIVGHDQQVLAAADQVLEVRRA
ncbi:hypothetical protein GCM10009551_102560 [Nocardiopsis tropica]